MTGDWLWFAIYIPAVAWGIWLNERRRREQGRGRR